MIYGLCISCGEMPLDKSSDNKLIPDSLLTQIYAAMCSH